MELEIKVFLKENKVGNDDKDSFCIEGYDVELKDILHIMELKIKFEDNIEVLIEKKILDKKCKFVDVIPDYIVLLILEDNSNGDKSTGSNLALPKYKTILNLRLLKYKNQDGKEKEITTDKTTKVTESENKKGEPILEVDGIQVTCANILDLIVEAIKAVIPLSLEEYNEVNKDCLPKDEPDLSSEPNR
ncbi:MAG: hypothetical protein ACI9RG_000922 [Sulfurimonas sp.]|jgi:hypothetical protein